MQRLVCLILAASLVSCAFVRSTQNEPIEPAVMELLKPNVTTAKQVVELLGGPTQVVELGSRTAYRYDHTVSKGAGLLLLIVNFGNVDTRSDRVWLFFDENEVLTHKGTTFASHRPQYATPWEDVHETSDSQAADAEREGLGSSRGDA